MMASAPLSAMACLKGISVIGCAGHDDIGGEAFWAETVTRVSETQVPDEHYQAAASAFSEKELVDLTIAIGLMNLYNRMAISFRNIPEAAKRVS